MNEDEDIYTPNGITIQEKIRDRHDDYLEEEEELDLDNRYRYDRGGNRSELNFDVRGEK